MTSPETSRLLRIQTVRSRSISLYDRLDAAFFANHATSASEHISVLRESGLAVEPIGSLAKVWMPPRTALVRATARESSLPYLRPYDVFDYLPRAADAVSVSRNKDIHAFQIKPGMILQTRSGRNLGPCTLADAVLANFAASDDMVRIEVNDTARRYYLFAYLQTKMGQALLRRGRSGSVIDHLTVADVSAVPVPFVKDDAIISTVATRMRDAIAAREQGRQELEAAMESLGRAFPATHTESSWSSWTVRAAEVGQRLDAAFYAPSVLAAREQLGSNQGARLGDLASAVLPVRYKRYYVEAGHGRPIVSGRQLLQAQPINLRFVADRSFRNPEDYEIRAGMTVFGAVGRAEGRQAWPSMVTSDRDGWLASNDVMRLVPRPGVRPGAVWLAVAMPQVQRQIKALSFGSVIDHMNPWDVEDVLVPLVEDGLATAVESAWGKLARASALADSAVALLEQELVSVTAEGLPS